MAINPLVAQAILQNRAPDIVGSFQQGREQARQASARKLTGQLLQQQFGTGQLGQLAGADHNAAIQLAGMLGIPANEQGRVKQFAQTSANTLALLNGDDPQGALNSMQEEKRRLNLLGIETPRIDQGIQELQTDPEGFQQNLTQLVNSFQQLGQLQISPAQAAAQQAEQRAAAATAEIEREEEGQIRKEVRGEIRGQLKDVSKESGIVKTNFKKIQNLIGEVRKGNRTAVAQALVALVKLGDPTSIVKESEMIGALNEKSPFAAILGVLGKSNTDQDVIDSIVKKIDPLNPEALKVEDVLATAGALVSSTVPDLQARFASSREQATGNLTEAGIKSIFTEGLSKRVSGLSELVPVQPETTATAPTPEEATAAQATPQTIQFLGFE